MRSYLSHACVVAMLLVPTVAFSDIVPDCDREEAFSGTPGSTLSGDTGYTGAYTALDGTNSYSYGAVEAHETFTLTGQRTYCDYSYYIYTYGEADMFLWDGQSGWMLAYATASGYCDPSADSDSLAANVDDGYIWLEGAGYNGQHISNAGDGGKPDGIYRYGSWHFDPGDSVHAEHVAITIGGMAEGGDNEGTAHACVHGHAYLHVH